MNARQKAKAIVDEHSKCCTHFTRKNLTDAIEQALQEAAKVEWPTREELMRACQEWGFDSLDGENCIEWLKSRLKNVGE